MLASQSTISRFINSLTEQNIDEFNRLLLRLADTVFKRRNQLILISDVDSTHADIYGKQEAANYNSDHGTDGFHPILVFDSIVLLEVTQRPGNVYTSHDADEFLRPLNHYQDFSCDMNILVSGDSGIATLAIYDLCDEAGCQFLVKLKYIPQLNDLTQYQAAPIKDARKFKIKLISNNVLDDFYWETLARIRAL